MTYMQKIEIKPQILPTNSQNVDSASELKFPNREEIDQLATDHYSFNEANLTPLEKLEAKDDWGLLLACIEERAFKNNGWERASKLKDIFTKRALGYSLTEIAKAHDLSSSAIGNIGKNQDRLVRYKYTDPILKGDLPYEPTDSFRQNLNFFPDKNLDFLTQIKKEMGEVNHLLERDLSSAVLFKVLSAASIFDLTDTSSEVQLESKAKTLTKVRKDFAEELNDCFSLIYKNIKNLDLSKLIEFKNELIEIKSVLGNDDNLADNMASAIRGIDENLTPVHLDILSEKFYRVNELVREIHEAYNQDPGNAFFQMESVSGTSVLCLKIAKSEDGLKISDDLVEKLKIYSSPKGRHQIGQHDESIKVEHFFHRVKGKKIRFNPGFAGVDEKLDLTHRDYARAGGKNAQIQIVEDPERGEYGFKVIKKDKGFYFSRDEIMVFQAR